jgi:phage tail sheath protein FI
MPEYLSPGVYVEETSFRAKSIEGVSTSTTAFVGPTRKGPIAAEGNPPQQPELLTSFGDFARIYGGLTSLQFAAGKPNFLAHAVLNYFNEGGGRLYVLRTAQDAVAAKLRLAGADDAAADRVVLRSRFAGGAGNGTLTVHEILATATNKALTAAAEGTLLRANGAAPVEPARIQGGKQGSFAVRNGGVLRLRVNGITLDLTFRGKTTEAVGQADLGATITLDDTNHTLTVTLNGSAQSIALANGAYTPAQLALAINSKLSSGYARLEGSKLVIGTDRLGFGGTVGVTQNDDFGYTAEVNATAVYNAVNNNVANLGAVTVADLNQIILSVGVPPNRVVAADAGGRLALSTELLGEAASLAVADATDVTVVSEHNAFGLDLPVPGSQPARGSNVRLYRKNALGEWRAADTNQLIPGADPAAEAGRFVRLTIEVKDADGEAELFDDVSLNKTDTSYIGNVLAKDPTSRVEALQHLVGCDVGDSCNSLQLHAALFPAGKTSGDIATGLAAAHTLLGGTDGTEPLAGAPDLSGTYAAAFEQLRGLEDVSIVAAPGYAGFESANYQAIQGLLISHAEKPRAYRIAVLDTPANLTPSQARLERARIDSHRAAIYYPWVTVANPLARPGTTEKREIQLPPSGFLCGIYARNDVEKSVAKAPANEVVRSALRFERDVNFAENQMLNPLGVNCLRFFPGRGYRVWGARTASSDPEWKYVNVRRFFNYLEASIDRGTQWAVFENNGERLWSNIRETVESFLYNEWISGNLLGSTPKEAYFVRCDRSTMTQNDLDNGRLICLIGVAALKPAEFVIFRIGQKTAEAKS